MLCVGTDFHALSFKSLGDVVMTSARPAPQLLGGMGPRLKSCSSKLGKGFSVSIRSGVHGVTMTTK